MDDTERIRLARQEWDNARANLDRLEGFKKIRFAQIKARKNGTSEAARDSQALLDPEWHTYVDGIREAQDLERITRGKWVNLVNLREDRLNADANMRSEMRLSR